jgi:hypothetical protein
MQTEILPSYGTERYYLLSEIEQKTTFVFLNELDEIHSAALGQTKKKRMSLSYAIFDYTQATAKIAAPRSPKPDAKDSLDRHEVEEIEQATVVFLKNMLALRDRGQESSTGRAFALFVEIRITAGVPWIYVKGRIQELMKRLGAGSS